MIPKLIHYCWFGRSEKNDKIKAYIETWKRIMPEYTFIEWNEDNFNVEQCRFSKEAYESKMYAFVSDYARMSILDSYGGIYLDVDVEVLKSLDGCLFNRCFFGYEGETGGIATCVIGAEPNTEIIRTIKEYYESIPFVNDSGHYNNRPNTLVVEDIIRKKYNVEFNWKEGKIEDIYFYDWHVFHPLSLITGKLSINENTLAIHRHTLLWVPFRTKVIKFIRLHIFIPLFGEKAYLAIERKRKR